MEEIIREVETMSIGVEMLFSCVYLSEGKVIIVT